MSLISSGKHMDEIKDAGYEMPSVNQIEVRCRIILVASHCFHILGLGM